MLALQLRSPTGLPLRTSAFVHCASTCDSMVRPCSALQESRCLGGFAGVLSGAMSSSHMT
jgi:hypothetical protein